MFLINGVFWGGRRAFEERSFYFLQFVMSLDIMRQRNIKNESGMSVGDTVDRGLPGCGGCNHAPSAKIQLSIHIGNMEDFDLKTVSGNFREF